MAKARLVVQQVLLLDNERYVAHIKVYEVSENPKYPQGYKVKCALIEKETGELVVLLDNHEPYGYHIHAKLPKDRNFRVSVRINGYSEAIELFFEEVKKVQYEK